MRGGGLSGCGMSCSSLVCASHLLSCSGACCARTGGGNALCGYVDVGRVELDPDPVPGMAFGDETGGARSHERIKHDAWLPACKARTALDRWLVRPGSPRRTAASTDAF